MLGLSVEGGYILADLLGFESTLLGIHVWRNTECIYLEFLSLNVVNKH